MELILMASAIEAATVTDVVTLADINESLQEIDTGLYFIFLALCVLIGITFLK